MFWCCAALRCAALRNTGLCCANGDHSTMSQCHLTANTLHKPYEQGTAKQKNHCSLQQVMRLQLLPRQGLLCCQQDRQNQGKIRHCVSSTFSVTACAEISPHHDNFQLYLPNCNSVWFGFTPSFSACCKQHSPDCLTMHSNMFALLFVAAPLFFDCTFSCHRCYRSLGYPASSYAHEPKQ